MDTVPQAPTPLDPYHKSLSVLMDDLLGRTFPQPPRSLVGLLHAGRPHSVDQVDVVLLATPSVGEVAPDKVVLVSF